MAVSAWGLILADTVELIAAITPTVDTQQAWRHIGETGLGRDRYFSTRESDPGEGVEVYGGGERQEQRSILLRTYYQTSPELQDRIDADHVDLISALQPTRTYPSGAWGALRVRAVGEWERDDDEDTGAITVVWPVRHIYRFGVTLI